MTAKSEPTAEQLAYIRVFHGALIRDGYHQHSQAAAIVLALLDAYDARGRELERLTRDAKELVSYLTHLEAKAQKDEDASQPGSIEKAFWLGSKVELRGAAYRIAQLFTPPSPGEAKP